MQVNGQMGNSTPCYAQSPNPSTPNVVHVIMSQISTNMQNLVTIPQGVSFPHMCEIAHQKYLLSFFFPGSSNGPQPMPLN